MSLADNAVARTEGSIRLTIQPDTSGYKTGLSTETTRYVTTTTTNACAVARPTAAAAMATVSTSSAPTTESGPSRWVRRLASSVAPRPSTAAAHANKLNHMAGCN